MGPDPAEVRLGVLERLDVALADRLAHRQDDVLSATRRHQKWLFRPEGGDEAWVAAALRLRGMKIKPADVAHVIGRTAGRFRQGDQEHAFIRGMLGVLQVTRDRAERGEAPNGWFLVDLFKILTADVARFRRNAVRGDHPWDGLLHVSYPPASALGSLLDSFTEDKCYRDIPARFRSLHPVRRAFRVMWRFARLAPLPDFNLPVAFVAMNACLLARGYPMLTPRNGDREFLVKVVTGPPPLRLTRWENRLLAQVETGSST